MVQSSLAFAQATCYRNGVAVPCEELTGVLWGSLAFVGFAAVIGIASTIFWLVMLIHAISKPVENKAMWVVVLVFTGIIGAILYYFMVKRKYQAPTVPMPPSQPMQSS